MKKLLKSLFGKLCHAGLSPNTSPKIPNISSQIQDESSGILNTKKSFEIQEVCEPLWDGASCVPATSVGAHAIFPCMTMYNHKFYDTACMITPLLMSFPCPYVSISISLSSWAVIKSVFC